MATIIWYPSKVMQHSFRADEDIDYEGEGFWYKEKAKP